MGDDALTALDGRLVHVFKSELGFSALTPVQGAVLPQLLSHRDVAAEACTGSGKTLAFLLPIIELIIRRRNEDAEVQGDEDEDNEIGNGSGDAASDEKAQRKQRKRLEKRRKAALNRPPGRWCAIIVSPTRELARQISLVARPFCDATGLNLHLLTGGTDVTIDVNRAREERCDLVVGTPGRIDDVMQRLGSFLLWRDFEALILDEADELLNMGFERTVSAILHRLPKHRRTGLFSATQTKEVKALIRAGLRNPAVISVQVQQSDSSTPRQTTPASLSNYYIECQPEEKLKLLCAFAESRPSQKIIVFFATCASVAFYEKALEAVLLDRGGGNPKGKAKGFEPRKPTFDQDRVMALHGKMPQSKRIKMYDAFCSREGGGLLFCTDVAARGVDIPDVDWIVQFDPPQDPAFFVHRVGRTARAGRSGKALVFLLPKETAYINLLEQRRVPVAPWPQAQADQLHNSTEYADILAKVKSAVLKDRDLLERGTKAFISYIRSYKEHKCNFIFRLKDLDMAKVATAFCLLRVPTISELRESVLGS